MSGRPTMQLLKALWLGLLASPAAVLWAATRGRPSRPGLAWLRWLLSALVAAAAVSLLLVDWRWQTVAALWAAFCVVGSLLVALVVGSFAESASEARESAETPWGRRTLAAALPLVIAMPCLLVVSRLASWLFVGDSLAALNPSAVDPEAIFGSLLNDVFWIVPAGVCFAAVSFRRGRLVAVEDLGRAAGAWVLFLLLRELLLQGGFGVLEGQLIGGVGFESWSWWRAVAIWWVMAFASVPITLHLAWGPGSAVRRAAAAAALLVAALVNLAVLVGSNGQIQFVVGRLLERSGHPQQALGWYARSFRTSSHKGLEAYLQHRIGLLLYKQGEVERAVRSLTRLTTGDGYYEDLVAEGAHYLARLEGARPGGQRVVLPGVEVRSELRRAYCAPNTLALVLGFLGRPIGVAELGEEATLLGSGTSGSDICFLLERYGFEQLLVPFATLEDLRWLIDRGLPALVYTPGHVLAVVGYDDRLETAVCYDTAKWDIWVDRPYAELERDWGKQLFLMGVVLPLEAGDADFLEARRRFGGGRAVAARQWWLQHDDDTAAGRVARLKRAVHTDPTFFPAIFDLLEMEPWAPESEDIGAWLREHADGEAAAGEATALLERPHVDSERLAAGLAAWYRCCGSPPELLELAVRLSRRGEFAELETAAGIAAARLGQAQRAAFLLENLAHEEGEALEALAAAHAALGQSDMAARAYKKLAWSVEDDRLEEALAAAEALAAGRGPGFLEDVYRAYLESRPDDVEALLHLAELSLDGVRENPDQRLERLQQARRAASSAWALAESDEARQRAQELLEATERGGEQPARAAG